MTVTGTGTGTNNFRLNRPHFDVLYCLEEPDEDESEDEKDKVGRDDVKIVLSSVPPVKTPWMTILLNV